MNDDELGRFLRAEIPEPGEGYWEQIDARIAAAAAERGAAPGVTDATQTDENVIRLTGMNDTIESPRSRFGPTLAALAAALVLIAGVGFVLTSDDGEEFAEVATGGDTEDTGDEGVDDGESSTDDGSTAEDTGDDTDDSSDQSEIDLGDAELPSIAPGDYVVVGSETVEAKLNPITDEAGLDAFFEPGDGVLSATGRRALYQDVEFIEMIVDVDAKALWFPAAKVVLVGETLDRIDAVSLVVPGPDPAALNRAPGFGRNDDRVAQPGESLSATGRRSLVDHREWLEVETTTGEVTWVQGIDVQVDGDIDIRETTEDLPSTAGGSFEVGRGGELEILDRPGFDGALIAGAEIGAIVDSTGRRALASGFEWYEVAIAEGQVGWVMANTVQPVDTIGGTSRLCYSDGFDVLVLDFSADAETFTGALAFLDSIEAVAGVRGGADFFVAVEPLGAAEDAGFVPGQETWTAFAEGMSIGERGLLPFVECTEVQSMVDQFDALVGTYPAIPFPD